MHSIVRGTPSRRTKDVQPPSPHREKRTASVLHTTSLPNNPEFHLVSARIINSFDTYDTLSIHPHFIKIMDEDKDKLLPKTQYQKMYGIFSSPLPQYVCTRELNEKKRLAEMASYVKIEQENKEYRRRKEQERRQECPAVAKKADPGPEAKQAKQLVKRKLKYNEHWSLDNVLAASAKRMRELQK